MPSIFDLQRWLQAGALDALKALEAGATGQLPLLIITAFLFGLLHAMLPGHGKLLLAGFHAGHGRYRDALVSSIIVILTHVGSAILIVLAGWEIMKRTLGGAGRAPQLEILSHGLVALIGLWLLWRAMRPHDHDVPAKTGPGLAFVAGLIPCPLTTFIMTYAVIKGVVFAGLVLSAAFAAGMIVTVSAFPLIAVLLRTRGLSWLSSARAYKGIRLIEILAALAVFVLGAWPLIR